MQRMGVQGSGNRFPSTFQGVSSKDMYPFTICGQGPPLKRKALSPLVHNMWRNEAIEIVRDASSPGFYSRLFNTFFEIPHFKMETAESIRRSLPREAWVTSIDLINAYFHITINQGYPKFIRSQTRDTLYQFKALLFGLSPAPWVFTKVMGEIKVLVYGMDINLCQYLDDWLIYSMGLRI